MFILAIDFVNFSNCDEVTICISVGFRSICIFCSLELDCRCNTPLASRLFIQSGAIVVARSFKVAQLFAECASEGCLLSF